MLELKGALVLTFRGSGKGNRDHSRLGSAVEGGRDAEKSKDSSLDEGELGFEALDESDTGMDRVMALDSGGEAQEAFGSGGQRASVMK